MILFASGMMSPNTRPCAIWANKLTILGVYVFDYMNVWHRTTGTKMYAIVHAIEKSFFVANLVKVCYDIVEIILLCIDKNTEV